jgi:hypothetical protein
MPDDLARIERALQQLEARVVACLRERQQQTNATEAARVHMPEHARTGFVSTLDEIESALYATGEAGSLRIVSEQHDAARIRMIYLRHLLARDIPRPYVDQALLEFPAGERRAPEVSASRPPPAVAPPQQSAWRAVLAWLAGLFGRAQPAAGKPPSSPVTPRGAVAARRSDEDEMRLIYLHKLMEEDRQKLLPAEERPAPLARDVRLPDFIANFTAKDFAEAHFAVRPRPGEPIARTPEELRAKLAKRQRDESA